MSTASYQGRKVDVLALQGGTSNVETLLDQSLFGTSNSGQVCAGINKLIQRWVLEFLTEAGSMPYAADRGCQFLTELYGGQLQSLIDVETAFMFAAIDVQRNLVNEEDDTWFDDERFDTATLLQATLAGDTVSLSVKISSVAGDSRVVIVPLAVVP